jgi:hypothetical protein
MKAMLDCLVSYYGLDEHERPGPQRYFHYHILAGPGPTAGSGVGFITTLAVYDEAQRCTYCHNVHTTERGGPAAAIAVAIRYLDYHHQHDRLEKLQGLVRGLDGDRLADAVSNEPATAQAL